MELFGIRLMGFDAANGRKLLITIGFVFAIVVLRAGLVAAVRLVTREHRNERTVFWTRQVAALVTAVLVALALLSIWFDDPKRLGSAAAIVTAGIAFALQKVITAFAGYVVIMRGKTFGVGDRITMGNVRGDVIALGFFQTTIMEMGQPSSIAQQADPAMWVHARQYTGRVVTVTNDKIFDEPVYNYTREFPFLWEEIRIPLKYGADRRRAEAILLESAAQETEDVRTMSAPLKGLLKRKYFLEVDEMGPRVYYRLTDNWLELSLRFLVRDRGIREVKDALYRRVLDAFEAAGIEIASATYEIVGVPPLTIDERSIQRLLEATRAPANGDGARRDDEAAHH